MNMKFDPQRRVLAATVCTVCLFACGSAYCAAEIHMYIADTKASSAAEQDNVTASGLTWNCAGNRCTISGPWPNPGVSACNALARKIGAIKYYGFSDRGKYLNKEQLDECNIGARPVALTGQVSSTVTKPVPSTSGAGEEAPTDLVVRNRKGISKKAERVTPSSSGNSGTVTTAAGLREDLRLDTVRVTGFNTATVDGRTVLENVSFEIQITNIGYEIFGKELNFGLNLMKGRIRSGRTGLLPAFTSEPIQSGIRPGQTRRHAFTVSPFTGETFAGTYTDQWITAMIWIGAMDDQNQDNNLVRYFFILNHAGGGTTAHSISRTE